MMSQDAYVKTMFAHLSYYARAVVFQPDHVLKAECCAYGQYRGGHGTGWFTYDELVALKDQQWVKRTPQKVPGAPALIAVMIPSHEGTYPLMTDLRGYKDENRSGPADYSTADYYVAKLGFRNIKSADPGTSFHKQLKTNSICLRGMQRHWKPDGSYGNEFRDTGHHGKNVQAGNGPARNGQASELRPWRDAN